VLVFAVAVFPLAIITVVQSVNHLSFIIAYSVGIEPTPPISTMGVLTSYTKRIFFETI
jgi:hypothetical protein